MPCCSALPVMCSASGATVRSPGGYVGAFCCDAVGPHVGPCGRLLKESGRRRRVALLAQVDIDHLAVLVDGTVGVDPAPASRM